MHNTYHITIDNSFRFLIIMIIIAIALIGLIIIIIVYIIQSGKTKRTEILSGKTPPGKKKKIIGKQLKKETKNNASILHKYIKNKIKQ